MLTMVKAAVGAPLPEPASARPARADDLAPLAAAALGGDPRAVRTFIVAVGGPMLRAVRKIMGAQHPDVDDVTQDAIMALLSALAGFRGESTIMHFACRVAVLTAMAARRRCETRHRWTAPEAPAHAVADTQGSSPLAGAMAARRRQLLRDLLDELPDPIAEALALHFVLGYTVDEIAVTARVPVNTVWSRLRLGKESLRRKVRSDARIAEVVEGDG
jgi:RNA polymerase sigma factor (sigma-70 family)